MESAQLAVMTGASSGVGLELARLFAGDGGRVEDVHEDLRDDGAVQLIYDVASGGGSDIRADLDIVDVNVRSTVHLAKLFLRDMAHANAGRAVSTSSTVAGMPAWYQTRYNASKAFTKFFSEH